MAGTELGKAYVQIVPSAQGISGSIESVLDPEASKAGQSTGAKIASFAKKAIVAAGIGAAFKKALDEGGKLQQSYIGGLETIYNGAEDQIRSFAREAAAAGISMNDYSEQAVSFGAALKQSFGDDIVGAAEAANRAILDMADNSAKMGTDIGSIQNAYQGFAKQNYTMLDNLKLGYGGTKAEMERLLADAEELSGVHYDIENLGDVYAAIHTIQEELGIAGVAADEAATTLSGSFGAMKAYWDNFLGSLALGENVDQQLNGLVQSVSTFVFGNLIPMAGTVISSLPGAIVTFLKTGVPMVLSGINDVLAQIGESAKTLAGSITSEKVTQWVTTAAPKIIGAAGSLIYNFAKGLLGNLDVIGTAVFKIGVEIVKGLGSALWGKITAAANGIKERFLAPINALRDKVKAVVERIKGFFKFKVSAPHVPLPHFSIAPAGWKLGDLLKGSKPSLSIKWYAEGGIMTQPTLFGGGEAGPEGIIPLDPFWAKLDQIGNAANNIDYDKLAGAMVKALAMINLTSILEIDGKEMARTTAPLMQQELDKISRRGNRKLGYI